MITAKTKFRPKDYTKIFCKLVHLPLSPQEERVVELLRCVENESPWGLAIRNSFVDYSAEGMRELFSQLLSQASDDEDTMFRILGGGAFNELLKLKPVE